MSTKGIQRYSGQSVLSLRTVRLLDDSRSCLFLVLFIVPGQKQSNAYGHIPWKAGTGGKPSAGCSVGAVGKFRSMKHGLVVTVRALNGEAVSGEVWLSLEHVVSEIAFFDLCVSKLLLAGRAVQNPTGHGRYLVKE